MDTRGIRSTATTALVTAVHTDDQLHAAESRDMVSDALAEEFGSRVRAGSAPNRRRAFRELFVVWNPLEFTAEHVRGILGPPSAAPPDALVYVVDDGLVATEWKFGLAGGVVTSISCRLGE